MSLPLSYSDQQYLEAVRSGEDPLVQDFYNKVYKMSYLEIMKLGVEEDDISEVYQESFCCFIDNVQREDFELTSQLSTYLISICKNQARAFRRKLMRLSLQPIQEEDEVGQIQDELTEDFEQIEESKRLTFLEEFEKMKAAGDECYQLIKLSYMEGKRNSTIAHILGKKSEDVVKTQKSRCLSYLRKAIFKRMCNG